MRMPPTTLITTVIDDDDDVAIVGAVPSLAMLASSASSSVANSSPRALNGTQHLMLAAPGQSPEGKFPLQAWVLTLIQLPPLEAQGEEEEGEGEEGEELADPPAMT